MRFNRRNRYPCRRVWYLDGQRLSPTASYGATDKAYRAARARPGGQLGGEPNTATALASVANGEALMRFTLRDLFWLILVAAVAAGWAAHLRYWIQVEERLVDRARLAESENHEL